jgi:hypothetical protein
VLAARATFEGATTPFPVLLDTGSPVSAVDDVALGIAPPGAATLRARIGGMRVWSNVDPPVPRLQLNDVQLFLAPLGAVGIGGDLFAPNGVIGGDNLGRFAVALDPRAPVPLVTLLPSVTTCSCDLADACQATFGVALGGGAQSIAIGDTLYPYPATRVIIDACLEPVRDPVSREEPCVVDGGPLQPGYATSGVDVRLVIATGFPGLALASGAYDRLRGAGAAAAARAQLPVEVRFPGRGAVETAGQATLGGPDAAALALVSREIFFGPCAELARSRRMRRYPPGITPTDANLLKEITCTDKQSDPTYLACCDQKGCKLRSSSGTTSICDDTDPAARAAAVVELAGPIPIAVLEEGTPYLRAVNEDLRPAISTANPPPVVEGVLGMEVLRRLVATVDYPGRRLIARCADEAPGCLAYPRFSNSESECDRQCTPPKALVEPQGFPPTSGMPGGRCPTAPRRTP